ncbi:mutator type transposase [Tanacetum coccineum]
MLCQWRVRKKGQEANPYEDYREFPSVFCLKINHGGTFTPPPMTRYKGGKVNWVDDIDSDTFSIVEVTSMLQELGYENPCMAYYYKKPNSELENGLVELVVDKDVYEMLMYVDKFKVIELYTDHTVKKQHVLTQEPLATIIDVTQPYSSSGNEAEVDVSEDEWLRESLKKLPIKSKKGQQSSRKEVGQSSRNGSGSENGSGSDSGSDSEDSDYFVDEENLIEDVDVDMAEFKRHTDPGVEWLGCKENVLEENEVFELEEVDHEEFDSGSDSDEGLLNGRDKHIITCLEYIREYLMKRIVNVQKVQDKCDGPLTPSTAKIFKLIVRAAAKLKVEWNGSDLYQVTCPWGDQFVVNLSERVCSCRKWELSGIPCTRAVASIWDQANNGIDTGIPESYCLPVHWLTTWKEMYKFKINPVNGPQGWKKSDVPTTIIPPKPHPQIGRPPKKRKKSAAELADEMMKSKKLTKTGKSVTCKSCKQVGHNSRGCKSKKGGGSQQAGVAGHGDAAHGSQQAGVHGSQTTQSTPQAS